MNVSLVFIFRNWTISNGETCCNEVGDTAPQFMTV